MSRAVGNRKWAFGLCVDSGEPAAATIEWWDLFNPSRSPSLCIPRLPMEAIAPPPLPVHLRSRPPRTRSNSSPPAVALPRTENRRGGRAARTRINAVDGAAAADLAAPVEITWQIAVGAIAGITPFAVAGIEFSKRIIAQRKCEVCQGSGLVLEDNKYYARCPSCGGFLPWQSWKRFFTG